MEEIKNRRIECVAKENYDNFCHAMLITSDMRKGKKIVIFGAGILGLQFGYTIESLGMEEFIFCDNDSTKWGKRNGDRLVVSPEEIAEKQDEYFVFLAIENYHACMQQLEEMGYREGNEWYNLTNCSERKLIKDFSRDWEADTLILGDCTAVNISISDEMKDSIADLLYRKNKVKVLGMNGIYMRLYYNIFSMNLCKMPALKKTVILLDLSIFYGKYHLFSKNQHTGVVRELQKISGIDTEEAVEFVKIVESRSENQIMDVGISPNREEHLSEMRIEQERRMHMKLNYLYRLQEDAESIQYLDWLLAECEEKEIENIYVIMPVNYKMGERYFGDTFYQRYEAIRDVVTKHIAEGKGKVLDLSYALGQDEFICLRSTNEGIREMGRKKIAALIEEIL